MADTDDSARQAPGEDEPLLVRPYILGGPAAPAPPAASAETWPEAAAEPEPPTEPVPAVGAPAPVTPGPPRRRRIAALVAAAALLLVAVTAFGLYSVLRPRSGATPQAIVDVSLPPYPASASASPAAGSPPAREQAPAAPAPPRTSATASSSPTPSRSSAPAAPPATSAPAGLAPTPRAASPASTLSAPPGEARTGPVTGAGGLCLDLNGAVAVEDNHIQVYECNRTAAQAWTLATDGTLRVMGLCAQVVADTGVHVTGCDGRRSAQWRAGPDRTLVNLATGGCLTDPENGGRSGSWSRVTDCTGAPGQHWRLP